MTLCALLLTAAKRRASACILAASGISCSTHRRYMCRAQLNSHGARKRARPSCCLWTQACAPQLLPVASHEQHTADTCTQAYPCRVSSSALHALSCTSRCRLLTIRGSTYTISSSCTVTPTCIGSRMQSMNPTCARSTVARCWLPVTRSGPRRASVQTWTAPSQDTSWRMRETCGDAGRGLWLRLVRAHMCVCVCVHGRGYTVCICCVWPSMCSVHVSMCMCMCTSAQSCDE